MHLYATVGWKTISLDQSGGEEIESETACGGGVSSLRQLLQDFCGAAVVNKQRHPLLSEEWEEEGEYQGMSVLLIVRDKKSSR
jgi:hypothetical protein